MTEEAKLVRPQNRSYVFAIVFRSRDLDALGKAVDAIRRQIVDAFIVYKHGPSLKHLFVVAGQNPQKGEGVEQTK